MNLRQAVNKAKDLVYFKKEEELTYAMDKIIEKLGDDELTAIAREYCHHPKCDSLERCPKAHSLCRDRLGIDTAFVWEAISHFRRKKLEKLRAVSEVLEYHSSSYEVPSSIVWQLKRRLSMEQDRLL